VLAISRAVTALTVIGAAALGWATMNMNVVLLMWIGVGGFVAALMGPLVIGSLWLGATRAGAISGFWAGAITFVLIRGRIIDGTWLAGTALEGFGEWFAFYSTNPYSAATFGAAVGAVVTVVVSRFTAPLPAEHLARLEGNGPNEPLPAGASAVARPG